MLCALCFVLDASEWESERVLYGISFVVHSLALTVCAFLSRVPFVLVHIYSIHISTCSSIFHLRLCDFCCSCCCLASILLTMNLIKPHHWLENIRWPEIQIQHINRAASNNNATIVISPIHRSSFAIDVDVESSLSSILASSWLNFFTVHAHTWIYWSIQLVR